MVTLRREQDASLVTLGSQTAARCLTNKHGFSSIKIPKIRVILLKGTIIVLEYWAAPLTAQGASMVLSGVSEQPAFDLRGWRLAN